jgi:SSS family solute:Na+ symporter
MQTLSHLDYIVFFVYFAIVASYGIWVYRRKSKTTTSASHEYFRHIRDFSGWRIG